MTQQVIAAQGFPGSGKTTFAQEWVNAAPQRARVSRDDLRRSVFGKDGILPQDQENQVTKILNSQLVYLLKTGYSVIVDNTNLRMRAVRELADLANRNGAEFVTHPIELDVEECIRRDKLRGEAGQRSVGEDVIRTFAQKFPRKNWPVFVQGQNVTPPQHYSGTPGKPIAVTIDIDGTVANHEGVRNPYDTSLYHLDKRHEDIISLAKIFRGAGYQIIFLSGRSVDFYEVTWAWLVKELGFIPTGLVMRKSGDMRNDAIIKPEIFFEQVAPFFDVKHHVDDRQRVVDAMREIGLPVLQCRPGDF